jgi:hypothetical protein
VGDGPSSAPKGSVRWAKIVGAALVVGAAAVLFFLLAASQPVIKVSDIASVRGRSTPATTPGLDGAEARRAEEVVGKLLVAIDGRDGAGFRALVSDPGDADVLRSQLDYLHEKFGGRPHRLRAARERREAGGPASGPVPVHVLFGDREDMLTVDVDGRGKVVAFHEDDPASWAEPDREK